MCRSVSPLAVDCRAGHWESLNKQASQRGTEMGPTSEQVRTLTIPQWVLILHSFIYTRPGSKTDHPLSWKTSSCFHPWWQKLLLSAENIVAREKRDPVVLHVIWMNCYDTGPPLPLDCLKTLSLEFLQVPLGNLLFTHVLLPAVSFIFFLFLSQPICILTSRIASVFLLGHSFSTF